MYISFDDERNFLINCELKSWMIDDLSNIENEATLHLKYQLSIKSRGIHEFSKFGVYRSLYSTIKIKLIFTNIFRIFLVAKYLILFLVLYRSMSVDISAYSPSCCRGTWGILWRWSDLDPLVLLSPTPHLRHQTRPKTLRYSSQETHTHYPCPHTRYTPLAQRGPLFSAKSSERETYHTLGIDRQIMGEMAVAHIDTDGVESREKVSEKIWRCATFEVATTTARESTGQAVMHSWRARGVEWGWLGAVRSSGRPPNHHLRRWRNHLGYLHPCWSSKMDVGGKLENLYVSPHVNFPMDGS